MGVQGLYEKSRENPDFYTCLDVDVDENLVRQAGTMENVFITPHIAGGTVEMRKRMFQKLANSIDQLVSEVS